MAYTQLPHDNTSPAASLLTPFSPTATGCTSYNQYQSESCRPPNWSRYWTDKVYYYSPAICPLGWLSAGAPRSSFGPRLETTETAIVCCPEGFDYVEISRCRKPTETRPVTTQKLTTVQSGTITTIASIGQPGVVIINAWADAVQVRWASSDLSRLATNPLVPGQVYIATSTAANSSQATASLSDHTSSGLSTGGKIAIGLGVPFGVLLCALGVFLIFCLRSRNKSDNSKTRYSAVAPESEKPDRFSIPQSVYGTPGLPPNVSFGDQALRYASPSPDHSETRSSFHQRPRSSTGLSAMAPEVLTDDSQLTRLRREQENIRTRKSRLLELQRLEEEEQRIQHALDRHPVEPS